MSTQNQQLEPEDIDSSLLTDGDYRDQATFRAALRRFLRVSEEHARKENITPQQHQLLLVVRGHPAYPQVTIGDVAESLQVRHHSASLLVDRSVQRGLLFRREDVVDRRRVLVALTPEGQEILDRVTQANRKHMSMLEGELFSESLRRALKVYVDRNKS